jgi:hypothetical protein
MRISLLLQREPFGPILEQTLAGFLESRTKQPHTVCWYPGRPDVEAIRRRGQQPWLCNIYVNAMFVPEAEPQIFDPIRREFGYSLVRWRRPLQQVYVALATSRPGARWLAQAGMGISPPLPGAERLLIVAGNHKIRLLDRAKGVVYGILKSGFPPHFMQREIEARRQAEELGLPVPPLEAVAEDGTWFRERYVSGTPTNRLAADEAVVGRAVADVARALHRLLEQTRREESLEDYAEGLRVRIQQLIRANHLLSDPEKQSLLSSTDAIFQQIGGLRPAVGDRITTALTHGDFQPANILVNQDGTWLIDWEYSARRQAGYDALVFVLRSRFPAGLATLLRRIVGESDSTLPLSLADWPGLNWQDASWRRVHGGLFLLEELALHLEENANSRFVRMGEGLVILQQEIDRWVTAEGGRL